MPCIVLRLVMWLLMIGASFPVQTLADDADTSIQARVSLKLNGAEPAGQTIVRFQWLGLSSQLNAGFRNPAFPLIDVGVVFGEPDGPRLQEPQPPQLVIYGLPLMLDGKSER